MVMQLQLVDLQASPAYLCIYFYCTMSGVSEEAVESGDTQNQWLALQVLPVSQGLCHAQCSIKERRCGFRKHIVTQDLFFFRALL